MTLAFVDTETTGLDPDVHEIWEVGLVVDETRHSWQLPVDLSRADPMALRINNYYERRLPIGQQTDPRGFASDFERLTRDRHLVGCVVSFDEERLRKLLRANGHCPGWHYHLIDVECLVVGQLGISPPWKSSELSEAIGVPLPTEAHTALGDALWAKAMYEAVMERAVPETG